MCAAVKVNGVAIYGRQLALSAQRFASTTYATTDDSTLRTKPFLYRDLKVVRATGAQLRPKPKPDDPLKFGHNFSDHMFEVDWNVSKGWGQPLISPLHNFDLHPASKVLHYAIELFEGMKAYRGVDNKLRLFRPEMNMERMRRSAARSALPDFSATEMIKIISELVNIDQEWVPRTKASSLYIRPAMIALDPTLGVGHPNEARLFVLTGPAGQYYATGFKPVSLLADPEYVRAFPGGVGQYKMGCNYAPSIMVSKVAAEKGCQQVLWLLGEDERITEVGTMNIMLFWKNEKGEEELVTPPLTDGIILPGVTRDSLLTLAREWNQFKVSERYVGMPEIRKALKEHRLYEIFGCGTACVVSPVGRILYRNKSKGNEYEDMIIPTMEHKPNLMQKLYDSIVDIQYGKVPRPEWLHDVV
uniref:branched-chain-amino-acid transaminase n=1 Tax=Ascaris suum TaxID=6253 RepID=F1L596_ASCSU